MEQDKRKIRIYKIFYSIIICLIILVAIIIAMFCTGALKEFISKHFKEKETTRAVQTTGVTISGVVPTYTPITFMTFSEVDYAVDITAPPVSTETATQESSVETTTEPENYN